MSSSQAHHVLRLGTSKCDGEVWPGPHHGPEL